MELRGDRIFGWMRKERGIVGRGRKRGHSGELFVKVTVVPKVEENNQ